MKRSLVTAPAEEPITLAEAKLHLRVDVSADDALITGLITAARQYCEKFTRRAFVTQTWDFSWDRFPSGCDRLDLALPPVMSITSISYVDTDGNSQTFSSSLYTVSEHHGVGTIYPIYNQEWPETRSERDAVTVRAVVGYGGASSVPEAIKAAIKTLVAHLYENREAVVLMPGVSDAITLPLTCEHLLWPYRVLEP